jgi:membrane protein DedA with SNARE-associated domain
MFEHYLGLAETWLTQYGYWALSGSIFVEGVGIPAPGQSLLIAAALLAEQGGLNILWVLLVAWSATVLGNALGYWVGLRGGYHLLKKAGVSAAHLQRVESVFSRYGGSMVVMARFFEVLRQLNGIVAGIMQMPWRYFMLLNMLGATLWVGVWGVGVWLAGRHLREIEHVLHIMEPFVIATVLLALAWGIVYLLRGR